MDNLTSQDPEALLAELEQSRERLGGLVQDLRAVDRELEGLSEESQQYRLLGQACSALEELDAVGAARLFWDGRAQNGDGADHLRLVRGRVDVFEKQLHEIEGKRQDVLDRIQQQEDGAELLEDDLYELQRREQERKLEWVIEREVDDLPARDLVMPWARGGADDDRFRKALAVSLLVSVLLGLLLPLIDLPLPARWEEIEVPERWTSLIEEQRPPPPPPVQQTNPENAKPKPEDTLVAEQAEPKKTAESKGILAFREKFSALAASQAPARLGSQARITNAGEPARGRPTRNMVATQASGSSGGINLASLSRDVGNGNGEAIAGVAVARATSSIGGVAGESRPLSNGPGLGRTDEEIQIVFDRHKAALYRLYNRELRRDPTLQGQMVLRIRIEPDGTVTLCDVQSSDLDAPELSAQVAARVRTFEFGAKDVPAITILYPIDFLPAT